MYLTNRFFLVFGALTALCALSFLWNDLFPLVQAFLLCASILTITDCMLLYLRRPAFILERRVPAIMTLNDINEVHIRLKNEGRQRFGITLIDELPFQFQRRDFKIQLNLGPGENSTIQYTLCPKTRGVYAFGYVQLFVQTMLGLAERRISAGLPAEIPVYPSIFQMKQYEMRALKQIAHETGIKKMRRIGHSYEFDQIKNYVHGDDYRSINWKASSRYNALMVNQYEDERSQQVYCLIDKSRVMRMPFEALSLMDYAINTSLAISNIVIKKQDKAGLISFSDVIGATLKAERDSGQMRRILESLYREQARPLESNFDLLYEAVRRLIGVRSLLLLFTNFESMYALERVLPVLRRMNAFHLLVVIIFENTEIQALAQEEPKTVADIYRQNVAQQFIFEKKEMVQKLRQYGIQAVLAKPKDLTLSTINKYLELKSRGLI
ncbi:MAG: DUF58 domain-containing protein [Bacteroidetes bacterium]|nr:DUF58 domain-containing protein [Bacteroidota bacterium]